MSNAEKSNDKQPDRKESHPTADFDVPVCEPGTQIGHFEIEREIGRGGMGVVYLAHDSKLDRHVAIKSMPPVVSDDNQVKSRFRREAKLLASLNHPDIATIYDIVEGEKGVSYLVLEYIPGDTLAERIARGPVPPKEALPLGGQIAAAFASAHEHGIVHRDLKPANIKITEERRVKVLDFGIAKAVGEQALDAYTTVTEPGQLIGTPEYMSPEQARGKPTDERSDIWSFGCVLYEMLTGRPPFESATPSDTLAGVLEREPDWHALPQSTPPNIKLLIRRCMEKDPQQRLQHIGDAALEIRETLSLPALVPPMTVASATVAQAVTTRRFLPVAVAVLALIVVVTSLITWSLLRPSPSQPDGIIKLSIPLGPIEETDLISSGQIPLLLSPDGKFLVVGNAQDETKRLHIRSLDSFKTTPIPGTEEAYDPFFSPDSQWLAFFTDESKEKYFLWKLKINSSGQKALLANGSDSFVGGCWNPDDTIIFCTRNKRNYSNSKMHRIYVTKDKQELIAEDESHYKYMYPRLLPNGKHVLCGMKDTTYLVSTVSGESEVLLEKAKDVQYSPSGHLLFRSKEQLFAQRFNAETLQITGPEILIVDGILSIFYSYTPSYTLSRTGTFAFVPKHVTARSLVWVDRMGNPIPVDGTPTKNYYRPRLSPDEKKILFLTRDINYNRQFWKYELSHQILTELRFDTVNIAFSNPSWVPSKRDQIYFQARLRDSSTKKSQLFVSNTDGIGELKPLIPIDPNVNRYNPIWSSDGSYLMYSEWDSETEDIWILPMGDNNNQGKPVLLDEDLISPVFHPSDNRYLAYVSGKTGSPREVYVGELKTDSLSIGQRRQISSEGGGEPCWSRDGTRLFYRSEGNMMEATIHLQADGTIELGERKDLFDLSDFVAEWWIENYDVDSDGRFLMIKKSPPTRINVIQNFDEELKRLAPTRKK